MPYKDPGLTQRTFPIIDGIRWGLSGDYATVNDDGTINLVGRGSRVINTEGEKVFAEEVEIALTSHPDITDCLVAGRSDERFGSSVVALVAVSEGAAVDHDAWTRHCRSLLAWLCCVQR